MSDELKEKALQMAITARGDLASRADETVELAKEYERYLRGEPEQPTAITADGARFE